MDYTLLVNKDHPLEKDFIPDNLVVYHEYNGDKIDPNHQTLVNETVLLAFYQMQQSAMVEGMKQGFSEGFHFVIDSAYRSYRYQEKILEYNLIEKGEEAYNLVAYPGTSEHQSGLAIDIALFTNGKYNDEFDDSFPEIKWLHENAHRFGFIIRYPKNYEAITGFNYECWHLRYVTPEVSIYMYENKIKTLEEYHELNRQK